MSQLTVDDWVREYRPQRPYASSDLSRGIYRMSREDAFEKRYIQINAKSSKNLIVADVDVDDAADHVYRLMADGLIPDPNLLVVNPDSTHAHVTWITDGYVNTDASLRLFGNVARGLRNLVADDVHFTGFITRSPLHEGHETEWMRGEPYKLADFYPYLSEDAAETRQAPRRAAESLSGPILLNKDPKVGERAFTLFEATRQFAYKAYRLAGSRLDLEEVVWRAAMDLNLSWSNPLPDGEVDATVRSIVRWVSKNFSPEGFTSYQRAMSHRRKVVQQAPDRWARFLEYKEDGLSHRDIALIEGISVNAVKLALRRARNASTPTNN